MKSLWVFLLNKYIKWYYWAVMGPACVSTSLLWTSGLCGRGAGPAWWCSDPSSQLHANWQQALCTQHRPACARSGVAHTTPCLCVYCLYCSHTLYSVLALWEQFLINNKLFLFLSLELRSSTAMARHSPPSLYQQQSPARPAASLFFSLYRPALFSPHTPIL